VAAGVTATATSAPATPTTTPVPGATPTNTAQATSTPVTPTSTAAPCNPQLGANVTQIPVALDGNSSFLLLNQSFCGGGSFALAVSSTSGPWLSVSPVDGNIGPAPATVTINVHVDAAKLPMAEGQYTATIRISGPGNPVNVVVVTSRGGQPPTIVSASGECSAGTATFAANVVDDIGVASVSLRYLESGGAAKAVAMAAGGEGAWSATVPLASAFGATGFTIVALDGANHVDNYTFTATGCG
jgi:hypothetical protein